MSLASVGESGECRQNRRVRSTRLGECRRVWRVGATRLGECRQVWRVTTSTQDTPKTRPRVLATFAKFALDKFAVKWPLLSFCLIFLLRISVNETSFTFPHPNPQKIRNCFIFSIFSTFLKLIVRNTFCCYFRPDFSTLFFGSICSVPLG